MKKTLFALTLCCITALTAAAQNVRIGYFSYKAVIQAMPEYATATAAVEKLRQQYAEELQSVQREFNEKYELFLDQQATLAESIRQKRQADLQTLLERNEQFRKESERLLKQAEQEAMAPLHAKLQEAIEKTGSQGGYLLIVNTDSEACPYISPEIAEDVTSQLSSLTK